MKTWRKRGISLGMCACLSLCLAGCQPAARQTSPGTPAESGTPSAGISSQAPSSGPQVPISSPSASSWQVDESTLTDEYLISLISGMEIGLTGDNSFTFSDPTELSEAELYLCFLLLSDYDELEANYYDPENQVFTFTSDVITDQLSKYFKDFHFDITQDSNYDAQADAIVTPLASGFGGDLQFILKDKSLDGNTVTFTVDFYGFDDNVDETDPYQTKTYTIEFYDGGYYYLSATSVSADCLTYYSQVLQNQQEFIVAWDGTVSYLDAYLASRYEDSTIDSFAVCDLDWDGSPEVILNEALGGNAYFYRLILHEQEGVVYGYSLPYRGFQGLKTDGTFHTSAGVFDNGTASITFDKENDTVNDITYCCSKTDPQTGQMEVFYFVDREEATLEQFQLAIRLEDAKPDAEWHDFTDENIKTLLGP